MQRAARISMSVYKYIYMQIFVRFCCKRQGGGSGAEAAGKVARKRRARWASDAPITHTERVRPSGRLARVHAAAAAAPELQPTARAPLGLLCISLVQHLGLRARRRVDTLRSGEEQAEPGPGEPNGRRPEGKPILGPHTNAHTNAGGRMIQIEMKKRQRTRSRGDSNYRPISSAEQGPRLAPKSLGQGWRPFGGDDDDHELA